MVKSEIIASLPSLKPEELDEIRIAIGRLRETEWLDPTLSDEDKALLQEALDDLADNPADSESWDVVRERVFAKYRK